MAGSALLRQPEPLTPEPTKRQRHVYPRRWRRRRPPVHPCPTWGRENPAGRRNIPAHEAACPPLTVCAHVWRSVRTPAPSFQVHTDQARPKTAGVHLWTTLQSVQDTMGRETRKMNKRHGQSAHLHCHVCHFKATMHSNWLETGHYGARTNTIPLKLHIRGAPERRNTPC